jgi:hypothetical protein
MSTALTIPVHRQRHMYHRCGLLDLRAEDLSMGPPRRVLVHVVPVRRLLAQSGHDLRGEFWSVA